MNNTETFHELAEWEQIAYGTLLVERMYPNFALFSEVTDSGGASVFRNILNLVWEYSSGKNSNIDFQKQLDKLELVTPDPSNFNVYGVWPALDAAVGLSSLLSACVRFEASEIISIEKLTESTIDNYLNAIDQKEDDSLYQSAREFKAEVLDMIISERDLGRTKLMPQLKQLVNDWGVSNIGISLT